MVLSIFSFSCVLFLFLQFSDSFFFLSQILLLRSLHSLIFMVTLYSCFSIIQGMIEKATKFYKGFRSTNHKQLKDRDRLLQVIHLYNTIRLFLALLSEEKSQDLRSSSDFHGKKIVLQENKSISSRRNFRLLTILRLVFLSLDPYLQIGKIWVL